MAFDICPSEQENIPSCKTFSLSSLNKQFCFRKYGHLTGARPGRDGELHLCSMKKGGVSQRLIWARNRSNLLFREDVSAVELPIPHIVSYLFLPKGEEAQIVDCDVSKY